MRINEDTASKKWILPLRENLKILTISKFIQAKLNLASLMLYDPYPFRNKLLEAVNTASPLKVGIIDRISYSKGIVRLFNLLAYFEQTKIDDVLFYLFGEADEKIINDEIFKKPSRY